MRSENTLTISCEKLSKLFGGVQALRNVTLEFSNSGIIAIIGPNGAGKTTLINILTGFIRPDSGHCYIADNETTYIPPHKIARLGVTRTFQDLRLINQVTAIDNVMMACPHQRGERLLSALTHYRIKNEEDQNYDKAIQVLRFVGIEEKANDFAGELSYGQQKLLTLACCLATEARILFLDEPVGGVHPELASHILSLLRKLQETDRLIIFIEHDIDAVRRIADIVVVMDEGRIIAQGQPDEVLKRPEIMEAYLA